jgi:hypothetical protein
MLILAIEMVRIKDTKLKSKTLSKAKKHPRHPIRSPRRLQPTCIWQIFIVSRTLGSIIDDGRFGVGIGFGGKYEASVKESIFIVIRWEMQRTRLPVSE